MEIKNLTEEYNIQKKSLEEQITKLTTDNKTLTTDNQTLTTDNQTLTNEKTTLTDKMTLLTDNFNKQTEKIEGLQNNIDSFKAQLSNCKSNLSECKNDLKSCQDTKVSNDDKIKTLEAENRQLKQALAYAEDNIEEVYIYVKEPAQVKPIQKNIVTPDIFRLPGDKLM